MTQLKTQNDLLLKQRSDEFDRIEKAIHTSVSQELGMVTGPPGRLLLVMEALSA